MSEFETLGQALETYFAGLERLYKTGDPASLEHALGDREERREEYRSYLQSDDWHEQRARVLVRAGWRCERCGVANVSLDVHHLHYGPRGREPLEDLIALCPACHGEAHREGA